MRIQKKEFTEIVLAQADRAREEVARKYDLHPVNNVYLICEKLFELKEKSGAYVECGVYQGHTMLTAATFLRNLGKNRDIYGFDTFQGFPVIEVDERDHPRYFTRLHELNSIDDEHLKRARERTKDFEDLSHLETTYFINSDHVFSKAKDFSNIHLVAGAFQKTLRKFEQPITVLFLDCDLYQSYKDCLEALYHLVLPGGVVIFDEYFSLKYPGARLAVDEFFEGKEGYFERYETDEGFERWCFRKA